MNYSLDEILARLMRAERDAIVDKAVPKDAELQAAALSALRGVLQADHGMSDEELSCASREFVHLMAELMMGLEGFLVGAVGKDKGTETKEARGKVAAMLFPPVMFMLIGRDLGFDAARCVLRSMLDGQDDSVKHLQERGADTNKFPTFAAWEQAQQGAAS